MSSSDDDLVPISLLKKRAAVKRKALTIANADDDDFEPTKPTNGRGANSTSSSSRAAAVASSAKSKRTAVALESDSDSDSVPLIQLKKRAADKKENSNSANGKANIKKEAAATATTGVKRKTPPTTSDSKRGIKTSKSAKATSVKDEKNKNTKKPSIKREAGNVRKLKVHSKGERLDMAIKAYRWWKAEELPEGIQWRTLEHNGVLFPPSYTPHGIPLLYNGKAIELTPLQEELASFYAAMPQDGPQLGNVKTAKIFNANFFQDFKKALGKTHEIKKFDLCDFSKIAEYLDKLREDKKNMTKEEKLPDKEKKENDQFENGVAIIDGHLEKVGNFRIEPPGLFRGRGEHPKTGSLKERVLPEEVTVNAGISDRVPICNTPGHAWKEVIHRDTVTWLAYWNESVMGGTKYVWLAASSSFKGKSDMAKYEKARRLKKSIDKIRKDYQKGLKAKDMLTKQRSTAMWVIDILALRVGNEKGEDEADTVGCCSLRVEHVSFQDTNCELTLSFLGKDSMPYNNTVELQQYGDVGKQVFANLKKFCEKKDKNEEVFNELSTTELNKHLSSLMPGLTAKVFRTYNASVTLQQELPHLIDPNGTKESAPKVVTYNDANRKVAILCNHQRTVPKSFDSTLEKMAAQVDQLKDQLKELKEMKNLVTKGKTKQIRLKEEDAKNDQDEKDALAKKANAHLFSRVPSVDQVAKKMDAWKKKLETLELKLQDKNDNKQVALGTSKINYMDPRISVAWCKRNEVPISAVFPKTLREKFVWAMDVDPEWKF